MFQRGSDLLKAFSAAAWRAGWRRQNGGWRAGSESRWEMSSDQNSYGITQEVLRKHELLALGAWPEGRT